MTNLATATAAPRTVTISGEEWTLSPFTDADWGEVEAWIQDRYIDVVRRAVASKPAALAEAELDRAYLRAASLAWTSPEGQRMLDTPAGAGLLFWLSARKSRPGLTRADIAKRMENLAWAAEAVGAFERVLRLSLPDAPKKKAPRRPIPTAKPKRKR